MGEETTVRLMIFLRVVIAVVSLGAAFLMYKYKTVVDGLRINAFVGLLNPILFLAISVIGVANMASKVSYSKLALTIIGVALILYGTSK